jgi:AcrR family transcriptional regulator
MEKEEKSTTMQAEQDATKTLRKARYHHGDLRSSLIEATRRLVEEKGPEGFSVTDACRLAGVSTAAPYKHFRDKQDMLVAVCLEGMERFRENTLSALKGIPEGTPERIKAIGLEYIRFALREPGVFRLKFGGFTDGIDDENLQAAGEAAFDIVLVEVATCLGSSEVTPEIRRRGFVLWSFVHGLSFILNDERLCRMAGDFELEPTLDDVARRVLA